MEHYSTINNNSKDTSTPTSTPVEENMHIDDGTQVEEAPSQPKASLPQRPLLPNAANNAWKTTKAKRDNPTSEQPDQISETEKHIRAARAILNKITEANFETLLPTLFMHIINRDVLTAVIDELYDKAILESQYVSLYAELCSRIVHLQKQNTLHRSADSGPCESEVDPVDLFESMIVDKCITRFRRSKQFRISPGQRTALSPAELAEKEKMYVLRTRGNVRFIADLINAHLISAFIGKKCIETLQEHSKDPAHPVDADMDALAIFVEALGAQIMDETPHYMEELVHYFQDIIAGGKLSKRVQFALQDVIDLYRNNSFPKYSHRFSKPESFTASSLPTPPHTSRTRLP